MYIIILYSRSVDLYIAETSMVSGHASKVSVPCRTGRRGVGALVEISAAVPRGATDGDGLRQDEALPCREMLVASWIILAWGLQGVYHRCTSTVNDH